MVIRGTSSQRDGFLEKDASGCGVRSGRRLQRRDRLRRGCGGSTSGHAEGPDCRREQRGAGGPEV